MSYRAQSRSTPSQYEVCTDARDVQPPVLLIGVAVIVVVVAVLSVRRDKGRQLLAASKDSRTVDGSCLQ